MDPSVIKGIGLTTLDIVLLIEIFLINMSKHILCLPVGETDLAAFLEGICRFGYPITLGCPS